jgi:hypothetical protein
MRKFFIYGRGWVFPKDTKFLAVSGVGYTKIIKNATPITVTAPEFLRFLWGDAAYEKTPKVLREPIEKHEIGFTITPDILSDEDNKLPRVNEEDINDQDELTIAKGLKSAVEDSQKTNLVQMILFAAIGGFLVYVLCNIHVLPVALKGG